MAALSSADGGGSTTLAPACIGIRLGSSSLTLAVSRLGVGFSPKPEVVAAYTGERVTPATVARAANGEWIMGEAARMQTAKNPKNTFTQLVKLAGQAYDAKALKPLLFDGAADEADGTVRFTAYENGTGKGAGSDVVLAEACKKPEELLALLLGQLKAMAEESVGAAPGVEVVRPCVLTAPSPLDANQKAALERAGAAAGLHILALISEPTAVALAHGADVYPPKGSGSGANDDDDDDDDDEEEEEKAADGGAAAAAAGGLTVAKAATSKLCLVVDLGGSSLTATVLSIDRGVVTTVAAETTEAVSGAAMVGALVAFAAKMFTKKTKGVDPLANRKAKATLTMFCERCLQSLSTNNDYALEIESLCEGMDLRQRVSRSRFEDLVGGATWDAAAKAVAAVLAKAGVSGTDVDHLYLAGGAARVPKLVKTIAATVSPSAAKSALAVPPDEAAALGAAMQAVRLVICGSSDSPAGPAAAALAGKENTAAGEGSAATFSADYASSALPAQVGGFLEVAAAAGAVALAVGGEAVTVVSEGAALPLRNLTATVVALPEGGEEEGGIKVGADGKVVVKVLELAAGAAGVAGKGVSLSAGEVDAACVATVTLTGLAAGKVIGLQASKICMAESGELSMTIAAVYPKSEFGGMGDSVDLVLPAP